MSVLVVGSVALDSVETPFGVRENLLGGSATYFAAAASLLTDVSVVGVIGEDFPAQELAFLRERGVSLDGLERKQGRTFRWKGKYGFDLNSPETLDTQLNVFADFDPRLNERQREAERLFLGNIDPVLQIRVLDQVRKPALICADTMNYWISSKRETLLRLLPRLDVLLINDGEVRQLAGEANVVKAGRAALRMGARAVVVKRGEYGALLMTADHSFYAPAFPVADVVDPTGAGDSFAGGFVGLLDRLDAHEPDMLRQATVMGSTVASFTVEQFSLDRLRSLDLAQVEARFGEFGRLTAFAGLQLTRGAIPLRACTAL
ncbi:MAG TPA: PfkB family carbohydrate kinase [Myxococcales bacterium]|nr:PfkB family carbohydrate kinase [Myxococcales bacterium]